MLTSAFIVNIPISEVAKPNISNDLRSSDKAGDRGFVGNARLRIANGVCERSVCTETDGWGPVGGVCSDGESADDCEDAKDGSDHFA